MASINALSGMPTLGLDEMFYWRVFQSLWFDRQITMSGAGAIPFTALITFADEYDLDREERDELFRVMRAMDAEWLHQQSKRQEREAKKSK